MLKASLITQTNLPEFFHREVCRAMQHQGTGARTETVQYLVNLLTLFSRTDALFDHTDRADRGLASKPLAMLYADARQNGSPRARRRALRRLADFALFISGVFPGRLARSAVGVDYYVSMGGAAYGQLSNVAPKSEQSAYGPVYDELATRFVDFVDVLGEIGATSAITSNGEVLRLYELWLHTGSRRAARRLQNAGFYPSETNVSRMQH